jgi:hypothetical protein
MEALRIVAQSWPMAFAFAVLVIGGVAFRIIGAIRQADREDKAHKANAATHVVAVNRPRAGED